jgi:hypothetical protein
VPFRHRSINQSRPSTNGWRTRAEGDESIKSSTRLWSIVSHRHKTGILQKIWDRLIWYLPYVGFLRRISSFIHE